jgi:hypothetical protein
MHAADAMAKSASKMNREEGIGGIAKEDEVVMSEMSPRSGKAGRSGKTGVKAKTIVRGKTGTIQ